MDILYGYQKSEDTTQPYYTYTSTHTLVLKLTAASAQWDMLT